MNSNKEERMRTKRKIRLPNFENLSLTRNRNEVH